MSRWLFPVLCLGLLVACATGPRYDVANVNTALTPAEAVQAIENHRGESVVWGGRIIQTHNLPERTRIEVLAYPLDSSQRPRLQSAAQGRFLIDYPGYLERADFAADREITVLGVLENVHDGHVGEAAYRYPVVQADDLHLWEPRRETTQPRVSLGLGISIGR